MIGIHGHKRKKIILVDANIFFSTKIVSRLEHLGYSVNTVNSYQGIKNNLSLGISAVIIDLSVHGINVLDIIKKLKESPETASIPLIGFAGHKEHALLKSARSFGCDLVTTNSAITLDMQALLDEIKV